MLVDSIANFKNNNNKVPGVDTSKVLAKPLVKQVNNDIKPQFFANNTNYHPENLKKNSLTGRFLSIFA